eukprot:359668-Chlamydomonas_euryale.AAC.5
MTMTRTATRSWRTTQTLTATMGRTASAPRPRDVRRAVAPVAARAAPPPGPALPSAACRRCWRGTGRCCCCCCWAA